MRASRATTPPRQTSKVIPVTGFISSLLAPSRRKIKICFSQTEWRDCWWKSCSTIAQSASICCLD